MRAQRPFEDDEEGEDPELHAGEVAPEVASELPELRLVHAVFDARAERSPPVLRDRLEDLSDRFSGPQAKVLRQQPIPRAYRICFRHLGLDPDVDRVPVERVVLDRLQAGGFKSRDRVRDAVTLATMETSVGIWALDADRLQGPPRIRVARAGAEDLGHAEPGRLVPGGRLVVADDVAPVAVLFGEIAPGHEPGPRTTRVLLFSVLVAGVPGIYAEEAFWVAAEALRAR